MEFKNAVFNAAKDGKLKRLKVFLDHRPKEEVEMLVSATTNGATPLVMASRNGHLDVADYLLEKCHADIEQVWCHFQGCPATGGKPLNFGGFHGKKNLSAPLFELAPNTDCTELSSRLLLFSGMFQRLRRVYAEGSGRPVLQLSQRQDAEKSSFVCSGPKKDIFSHLSRNRQITEKGFLPAGNTALHDCAESGSLEILRLLLDHGAKAERDAYGLTPLLAAAVTGHASVVEFLAGLPDCPRDQRVEASPVATISSVGTTKKANSGKKGSLSSPRRSLVAGPSGPARPRPRRRTASMSARRCSHPTITSIQLLYCVERVLSATLFQALLVRERVLGPAHPDTAYYIRYRGAVYADLGDFPRCVSLWLYALDMQQCCLEPFSPMTQSSLLSFAELFCFMMAEARPSRPSRRHLAPVEFADVLTVFERAILELRSAGRHSPHSPQTAEGIHRTLVIALQLAALLCRLEPQNDENERFRRAAYRLVRLDIRGANGDTSLHIACRREPTCLGRQTPALGTVCADSFPAPELVRLLLDVGADPNATDDDLSTPLHVAARSRPCARSAAAALLARGAHLDRADRFGRTALDYAPALVEGSPLRFAGLRCLCARAIVRQGVPFRGLVPRELESFVQCH
ncbi:unnamed protein product [Ixodes hexagonus]